MIHIYNTIHPNCLTVNNCFTDIYSFKIFNFVLNSLTPKKLYHFRHGCPLSVSPIFLFLLSLYFLFTQFGECTIAQGPSCQARIFTWINSITPVFTEAYTTINVQIHLKGIFRDLLVILTPPFCNIHQSL